MKSSSQVVVIGGGVVGASVLYHLTEAGWTDVVLVERKELTAGSTWHSAGGMHTLNGDPNVSKLQQYTIELYQQIEARSGQDCSIHLPGGLMLADDRERLDWLRMAQARGRYLGMELEIITPPRPRRCSRCSRSSTSSARCSIPSRATSTRAASPTPTPSAPARRAPRSYRHTWVYDLRQRPDGTWDVITDQGEIHAEHIVNAGGLWAREVGRMIGLELPVLGMEHMYLVTEDMDEVAEHRAATGRELPMALDFAGEIYIRQEGGGMLLGTYEQACVPWQPQQAPWSFDMELLRPDLDRIAPSLEIAFKHYPAMATAGIKRIINGPFTFAPDGNPLVGPIRGVRNCWVACAVMAGLSQGGGVGLALANWMTTGDPQLDIWGDGRRPLRRLGQPRLHERQGAGELQPPLPHHVPQRGAAGRPAAAHDADLRPAHRAQRRVGRRLRARAPAVVPAAGEEPVEDVTFRRSNAFPVVAEECRAVRERVGLTECSNFAKYRVTGAGSAAWLQGLFTNRLPKVGRIALTAMLNPDGRIVGEFSVARTGDDEFFLFGSQAAEVHHSRWFLAHLPAGHRSDFEVLGLSLVGLSIAGPHARDVLQSVTPTSLATTDFPFMTFRRIDIGMIPAWVGRMTYTGDLGYEIWVAPEHQRALFDLLWDAGPAVRDRAVRLPGADVVAHGEAVRHLVPRVPADLHAARGRDGPVPQARPRLRRAGGRRGRAGSAARSGRSSTSRSTPTPTSPPT